MVQKRLKILVTGGAGFIGSEFVRQSVKKGYQIIVVDKLSYAGDLTRLKEVRHQIKFYKVDICDEKKLADIFKKEKPAMVVHFAAETHVDRSILDARPFIRTNILGTQNLVNLSRKYKILKFIHISSDEVYGPRKRGKFKEGALLAPRNPYSATKAAAELLIQAAINTHQLPAVIVRPTNNYGPWQHPEKFIPVIILKALKNQKLPVYGKGKQIREWLYVADCVDAIHVILRKGKIGEVYNIGSTHEGANLETAKTILKLLQKPPSLIQFVKDRPGHDFRYGVDFAKIKKTGWKPTISFHDGLAETLHWYYRNMDLVEEWTKGLRRYREGLIN